MRPTRAEFRTALRHPLDFWSWVTGFTRGPVRLLEAHRVCLCAAQYTEAELDVVERAAARDRLTSEEAFARETRLNIEIDAMADVGLLRVAGEMTQK